MGEPSVDAGGVHQRLRFYTVRAQLVLVNYSENNRRAPVYSPVCRLV